MPPAVSQFKTAYKCCFKASQPTVHSSGAIVVKRSESSQKLCAPRVSLLLGRLYTAWGDFLPLAYFAVCRRGWADFTPVGRDKPGASRSAAKCCTRAPKARSSYRRDIFLYSTIHRKHHCACSPSGQRPQGWDSPNYDCTLHPKPQTLNLKLLNL